MAYAAQKDWINKEYIKTQQPAYSKEQFIEFITKVQQPVSYICPDGTTILCNDNESACVTNIVLCAMYGVLYQQKKI